MVFVMSMNPYFKSGKGLTREIVDRNFKNEKRAAMDAGFSFEITWSNFSKCQCLSWGGNMDDLDFNDIQYYVKPSEKQGKTWEEVPSEIKETFDKLGIPEAEQKFLAGVSAQYESEVVYHSMQKDLEDQGVIFTDTDSALREHPELFQRIFRNDHSSNRQ